MTIGRMSLVGRCDLGACLYVAGTGDNEERRDIISFYRLAEPEGESDRRVEAERYRMVLPDGTSGHRGDVRPAHR